MSSEATTGLASREKRMFTVAGIATSRGFASGRIFLYRGDGDAPVSECGIQPERIPAEIARYAAARAETRRRIEAVAADLRRTQTAGDPGGEIFANHISILEDEEIVGGVERTIKTDCVCTEAALRRETQRWRTLFARMDDPYIRERVRDLDDVERRLLRVLSGGVDAPFARISSPVIIVAEDITPSETASMPRKFVLGFATDRGSATSHAALLARAIGIPAVTGLGDLSSRVEAGDEILLDGAGGSVTVNPDAAARSRYEQAARRDREIASRLESDAPGTMKDGTDVRLCANAQPGVPIAPFAACGARGVGLYRSEYLWLDGGGEPSEEVQTSVYTAAVKEASALGAGAFVVFRCLDLGGDKFVRGARKTEANPFLGNRSIRYLLSDRAVFRAQLRAILRASAHGRAAVMYPMVAAIEELRAANAELQAAMDQLRMAGIPFDTNIRRGVMIEVPSAALNAAAFAREADFFSIGTNDLVQYTMAADRGNELVAHLCQPTNPAVVRLVAMAADAANAAGIPVSVCGETASDPVLAALWIGLGVTELSMSAAYIPIVRKTLGGITSAEAKEMADGAKAMCASSSAADIYAYAKDFLSARIPGFEDILSLAKT